MASALTHSLLSDHEQTQKQSGSRRILGGRDRSDDAKSAYDTYTNKEYQKKLWKQLKIYSGWNVTRVAIIAILVCIYNVRNQSEINGYDHDCCRCYYVARDPETYGLDPDKRIDRSYCMPQCVDCKHCKNAYHNNGIPYALYTYFRSEKH